jgi:hypothetical protein
MLGFGWEGADVSDMLIALIPRVSGTRPVAAWCRGFES